MSTQLFNPFVPLVKYAVSARYRAVFSLLLFPGCISALLVITFLLNVSCVFAQSVGDYRTNAGSMNWNATSNWQRWNGSTWVTNPSQGYPGQNSGTGVVTIQNGHSVTLNISPAQNIGSLVVGSSSASLELGNNNTDRNLSVTGNITINNGGSIITAGNGGNSIDIGGNLTNNGTLDLNIGSASADLIFNGSSNQQLTGTGTTTDVNTVNINNSGSAGNNIVEVSSSAFTAAAGFLVLTKGIIKMSGSYTLNNTFFSTANPTIASDEGIWLNNPNVTVTGQNGDTQLSGVIRITAGTYNVGVTSDWWLQYNSGASIIVEGGALNVSGALFGNTGYSTLTYTQSSGTVTICTVGNNYSVPSFGIQASGSSFTMTGGTLVVQKPAGVYDDYINYAATSLVTGGTVQFGDPSSPTSALFYMKSTPSFYNMVVYSSNTPTVRLFTPTTFVNDVTIGGVLDAATNNVNVTVQRNWINNGSFLPGTATVTFNSTTQAQVIGGSASTTFYNLTNSNTNAAGLSLATSITVNNVLSLASSSNGKLNIGSNNLTIASGGSISGATSSRYIVTAPTTSTNGRLRQNNLGASARVFPIGTTSLYLPATISPASAGSDFSISVFRSTTTNGVPGGPAFANRSDHVDAVWQIDRAAGSANAHIRLDWYTNTIEGATFSSLANSAIGVWRYIGAHWMLIPSPTAFSNSNTSNYASTAASAVSNFGTAGTGYPYIIGNVVILPSALKLFTAANAGSGNQLSWEVENAGMYKNFELQQSNDGVHFNYLYAVTPTQDVRYTYFDAGVAAQGKKYYQLKLTDYYGTVTYSQIVSVGGKKESKLTVLQNPVQSQLRFSHPEAVNATYTVVDVSGRIMTRGVIPANAVITSANINNLTNGTYILQYADGKQVFSQLFLKQ